MYRASVYDAKNFSDFENNKSQYLNSINLDLSEMHLAWFTYLEPGKGFTGKAGKVLSSPTSADVLGQGGNNFKSTATLARWTGAVSE